MTQHTWKVRKGKHKVLTKKKLKKDLDIARKRFTWKPKKIFHNSSMQKWLIIDVPFQASSSSYLFLNSSTIFLSLPLTCDFSLNIPLPLLREINLITLFKGNLPIKIAL